MDALDTVATELGLDPDLCTEPVLLEDILVNTMHLGSFAPFRAVVEPHLAEPEPLWPLITAVKAALRRRHPILVQALGEGAAGGALPCDPPTARWMLHYMVLLEHLAQALVQRPDFLVALHAHVLELRERSDIPGGFFGFVEAVHEATGGGLFEAAKVRTLDLVVGQYLAWRARSPGPLPDGELFRKNAGLKLNIMEAVVKDVGAGHLDNAHVGAKLALMAVQSIEVVGAERGVKQVLPPGWVTLYQSWNLAFLVANLENLDLLIPKLLIPTVLDAEPEDYLFRRGVVLWYVANMTLFCLIAEGGRRDQRVVRDPSWAERCAAITQDASQGFLDGHRRA